jgi:hypothetical protein
MREKEEREREGENHRKGYIHNVDQSSISFFVTNFPEDCNAADLWKVFGRFGRLGDVYIPNKVDKWGKRFAFVKFREEKYVEELSDSLDDIWLGSFKLKVNRLRFGRKEVDKKQDVEQQKRKEICVQEKVVGGRSFKEALVNLTNGRKETALRKEEVEEVLTVEVDANIVKELEESFVGRLAVNVEVCRIRTVLFMEGFAHISVTDMGRHMVLIHSPKVGEVAKLWKDRVDWISYYFREVFPWSPSCYADRRNTWVKVYGIPLHVWGDKLFKVIGEKYGEFLDYDNNTASRAKLDVAHLKISTNFRGMIDDPVQIKALGVNYTLRVVEEKVLYSGYYYGERLEDQENSWVESVNFPAEGREVGGGRKGGTEVEEVRDEVVGFQIVQHHEHGETDMHDGDESLVFGRKEQNQPLLSGGMLEDHLGKLVQKDKEGVTVCADKGESGESQVKMLLLENGVEECVHVPEEVTATWPVGKGADSSGAFNEKVNRFLSEPLPSQSITRSVSLPPNRGIGSVNVLGRNNIEDMDFNDSISLVEERRGVDTVNADCTNTTQECHHKQGVRRGRSRKQRDWE